MDAVKMVPAFELELELEKAHSRFLERLIAALYGPEWERLTVCEAAKWHKEHFKKITLCLHEGD